MEKELFSKHYLYIHKNQKGIVFYVGIGTKQYGDHRNPKLKYSRAFSKNRNSFWKNIVKKYGFPNVEIIMESNDYDLIKQKEIELISFYGRADLKKGTLCNLDDGGSGCCGHKMSEYTRLKLIEGGKLFRENSKELLDELHKQTSIRMIGNKYRVGFKLTEEQKINLRKNWIEKVCKRVIQEDDEGNFIKEWYTTVEAAKFYGVTSKAIWKACKHGERCKKFRWRFKEK